tara:strand:- start:756 stop:932 length:177 start_codon:yes stop_codon:yes gene_type:complete
MNVHNQKKFFQQIYLNSDGNMVIVVEPVTAPTEKGVSQYNTFQKLTLTPEGYLKVYTD